MQKQGASNDKAKANFWLVDYRGLVTSERPGLEANASPFARTCVEAEGEPLEAVVRRVPTVAPQQPHNCLTCTRA